jgi:FlgD Ig-like domain
MKFILVLIIVLISSMIVSQNTWTQYYDPFAVDGYGGHDVIKCSDGGYVVNGSCYIEDPQNPGSSLENYGFTMKVDIEGNLEWVKKDTVSFIPMNQGSALVQTSDGGFITAVIPWLAGQGALIKRDADGNREWTLNPGLWVHSIASANDGNFVIVGGDYEHLVFQKWSLSGDEIWTKLFDDTNLKSIFKTQSEGFLLSGYIDNNGSNFDKDVFVAKTDAYGDTLWTKTYDAYGNWDQGNCVIETNDSNIMLTGGLASQTQKGFIWLLDSFGNTIWFEEVDSTIGWEHWSLAEYQENEYIAFCGFNYDCKFYGFDGNYSILWEIENIGGASGDRCFCVDGEYIIWPETGSSFILHKAIPDLISVNDKTINEVELLLSNYPNPFNPTTTIEFSIQHNSKIELSIYNIKGQRVKILAQNNFTKGSHSIIWDGIDESGKYVSSGIYYYKLEANGKTEVFKKCLLLK